MKKRGLLPVYSGLILLFLMLPACLIFSQAIDINWSQPRQEIDGFGASAAFRQADDLKAFPVAERNKVLDLLFSQSTGIGLSIVRNMIGDGSIGEWGNTTDGPIETIEATKGTWNYAAVDEQIWFMQEAKARGCTRFVSTAWSPPRWMKDNNSCINGGNLLTSAYADYATYLVNYVVEYMKNRNGIDIYGICPSNEPDMTVGYSSCRWTGEQFRVFIRDNLGPKLEAASPATKIILGEHSNWTEEPAVASLNDATAVNYVDIVAAHNYNNSTYNKFSTASSKNKKVWQVEVSNLNTNDASMTDGLRWAKQVHNFLVNAEGNAWCYWWAICYKVNPGTGEGLISINTSNNTWSTNKRVFTFGNYTKFIRPGWVRLTTSASAVNQASITAFKDPASGKCAVVAINESGSSQAIQFKFTGTTVNTLTPYLTSASSDLAKQADISASSGTFSVTLPGSSVTTFVSGGTTPGTLGDVNGDGAITIIDAMLVAQYAAGMNPTGFIAANADTSKDGQITIVDALLIARYAAGIITSF